MDIERRKTTLFKIGIDSKNILDSKLPRTRSKGPMRFLNHNILFSLYVDTDKPSKQIGNLLNRFEDEDAVVTSIGRSAIERWDEVDEDVVPMSHEELDAPAFIGSNLNVSSMWINKKGKKIDETRMSFSASKGYFTVKEIADLVVKFEEKDRPKSKWFGGVDAHHVFFEGLEKNEDDSYRIRWGS